MRTTNLLIFILFLNASVTFMAWSGYSDTMGIDPETGVNTSALDEQANTTAEGTTGSVLDSVVTGFKLAVNFFGNVITFVWALPTMLDNMGLPRALVDFAMAGVYLAVAIDILVAIKGGDIQ